MFDQSGALHHVGEVGSGLKASDLRALNELPLPFVVEVEYNGISKSGKLRFPRFKGLRDDIDPTDQEAINIGQFIGVSVTT